MKFPVRSLFLVAAWFATTAWSPAQDANAPAPASTPDLVTIPLPQGNDRAAGTLPADDGLLREGLNQSSHPQAAPILVIKPAAAPASQSLRPLVRHHARTQHPVAHPMKKQSALAARTVKPRSPVVSFVYWWNGWVIRTFHTKVGTVLLGTVGAKA